MSVWFITPAYQRYELSAVCFEQRRQTMDAMAERGVEARCVVVADDDNLDIARFYGFDTVEQNNDWLGRRFNDGMQYAAEHGAEWIVPVGSDTWVHIDYLLPLGKIRKVRRASLCSVVTADRLAELRVGNNGVGPYMFHRRLLAPVHFRPSKDEIRRRVDGSTVKRLRPYLRWEVRDIDTLQHIGFRGTPHITPYDSLVKAWGIAEHSDPWPRLATRYPADLVMRARTAMIAA